MSPISYSSLVETHHPLHRSISLEANLEALQQQHQELSILHLVIQRVQLLAVSTLELVLQPPHLLNLLYLATPQLLLLHLLQIAHSISIHLTILHQQLLALDQHQQEHPLSNDMCQRLTH